MKCPNCSAPKTVQLREKTALGYARFRCRVCRRKFNQRTGTPFNHLETPTDIVLLVVRWRLRYKLSLRDFVEMFLERGFEFSHETVRDWEARFTPLLTDALRKKRRGRAGPSWYVDETYVKISGRWCYLYRAIDRDGNLVDCRLSEKRDMKAARAFFRQALDVAVEAPDRVTTDGHDSYPRAIKTELGDDVLHRTNRYLNNLIEQDHRGIKQRYYPMLGFKAFESAERFCPAFDELRNYYRPIRQRGDLVSSSDRRRMHIEKTKRLDQLILVAA